MWLEIWSTDNDGSQESKLSVPVGMKWLMGDLRVDEDDAQVSE
jgi:hypothetical protein